MACPTTAGICTGVTYKKVLKLTFFKGAALNDPPGPFNSSLGGKVRRAVDFKENDVYAAPLDCSLVPVRSGLLACGGSSFRRLARWRPGSTGAAGGAPWPSRTSRSILRSGLPD